MYMLLLINCTRQTVVITTTMASHLAPIQWTTDTVVDDTKCKENVQFCQHSYIAHFPQIPIIGILCYFVWSLADRLNNVGLSDMMAKRVESRICEVAIKNSWVWFVSLFTGQGAAASRFSAFPSHPRAPTPTIGNEVCRYNWHSAGSPGWPFPMLK